MHISRTYNSGDLIYKEEPFVQVLPKFFRNELCESCRCRAFNLRACKECLVVKYCGRQCQKKDWNMHRLECHHMKNLTEEKDDFIRLLGRIILKIQGKDWKSLKVAVLGTEVSFDDIDSHYREMTENTDLNLMYKELKQRTNKFIGAGNMPSDIDLVKIIGKLIYNTLLDEDKNHPAVCFFIGMSIFERECIPNASFIVKRSKLKVWANKKIDKGSNKITVSFRRLFEPNLHIFEYIDEKTCSCSDCSLRYGDGVLSKILDEKRAYSIIKSTQFLLKTASVLEKFQMEYSLKPVIDHTLTKHNGVLGRTNILHLKLIALRCLQVGGTASDLKEKLLELESIMSSVYGEYYIEMRGIYQLLSIVYLDMGNLMLWRQYLLKVERLANIN